MPAELLRTRIKMAREWVTRVGAYSWMDWWREGCLHVSICGMLWVGHMRGHFKDNIDNLELGGGQDIRVCDCVGRWDILIDVAWQIVGECNLCLKE